jgi:aspartate/methionine/tyrosine aminotransferase
MELARRHSLFVISDETYRELVFDMLTIASIVFWL